jgi:sphinganine-1-phosphate aldolase
VQSSVVKEIPGRPPFKALPPAGLSGNQLREALIQYQSANSEAYLEGRVSGAIYSANTDLLSLVTEAFGMFYLSNVSQCQ